MTRVLLVHNYYRERGGEDRAFESDVALLEQAGHQVSTYTRHNNSIPGRGGVTAPATALWNKRSFQEVTRLILRERPDLMHVHNTLPLVSPAVFWAARRQGVPAVQTLHNYRLHCPAATYFRDGRVCEDCLGKRVAWPAAVHSCYRDSVPASAAVAAALAIHRGAGTWEKVDRYIALTEFSRAKFVEGGIPESRIAVRANFINPDPGPGAGTGGYALFVGRLSDEKGIQTLLDAWRHLDGRLALKIVGEGPLAPGVRAAAEQMPDVTWTARLPAAEVMALMADAYLQVVPSTCYETFSMVCAEAMACGTPVVGSDLGAVAELVVDGATGLTFRAGNAADLVAKVGWLADHPDAAARMRGEARARFDAHYSAEVCYQSLMDIYSQLVPEGNDR